MSLVSVLYLVALFFVLTPGVLVSLPPGGKKMTVALAHAVLFAVVYQLTHKMVARALDGFDDMAAPCTKDADCLAPMKCKSNKCAA